MCKKFVLFLLALSIIFSLGCTYQDIENGTSSLVFRLPGNSKALPTQNDVTSYSVTVRNDSFGYNVTKTGVPGSTMSYTGLIVGMYQINVEASDASAAVIFVGSSEVEIEYNMSTNVQIQLNYATGDITIGFTFPTEPTENIAHKFIAFEMEYLDLDSGIVYQSDFIMDPTEPWDIKVAYNSNNVIHSVIFQNQMTGVRIAQLSGIAFSDVHAASLSGLVFTPDLIDLPFSSDKVILIKTETNSIFKLGNPIETEAGLFLDYAIVTTEPTATPTTEPTIEPTPIPSPTPVPTNVTVEKIGTEHIVTIPISSQNFTIDVYYNEEPFDPMSTRTEFSVWTDLNASIPDIDPGDTITYNVRFLNPLKVNRNDVPSIAISIGGMCTFAGCMIPSYEYSIIPDGDISFTVGNAGCYTTCPVATGNLDGLWFNMFTPQDSLTEGAILNGFTASFVIPATLANENGTSCLSNFRCYTTYYSDERSNPLPFVLVE